MWPATRQASFVVCVWAREPYKKKIVRDAMMSMKSTETAPLLLPVRHGTIRSSIYNLTATAVGAGVLVLPFSFQASGLILGWALLLFFGLVAWASFHFLEESCRLAKEPITTFEGYVHL